jgi:hypothetical protein
MQIGVSPGIIEMPEPIYLGSFRERSWGMKKERELVALTVVVVLGPSGYAFVNSKSVTLSGAGSGSGPVCGYNIPNIGYR